MHLVYGNTPWPIYFLSTSAVAVRSCRVLRQANGNIDLRGHIMFYFDNIPFALLSFFCSRSSYSKLTSLSYYVCSHWQSSRQLGTCQVGLLPFPVTKPPCSIMHACYARVHCTVSANLSIFYRFFCPARLELTRFYCDLLYIYCSVG